MRETFVWRGVERPSNQPWGCSRNRPPVPPRKFGPKLRLPHLNVSPDTHRLVAWEAARSGKRICETVDRLIIEALERERANQESGEA